MKDRILELAKECELPPIMLAPIVLQKIEAIYKAAHQYGQRAMRERAAKEAEDSSYGITAAAHIRNLEITNE